MNVIPTFPTYSDIYGDGGFVNKNGFKNTHSEKTPLNKTPALTKSINMDIWVAGTSNQLFVRGS